MKKEVKTVQEGENLLDVVKQTIISLGEEFSMIHIDNELIDKNTLKKSESYRSAYEIDFGNGYIMTIDDGENETTEWWNLWFLELPSSNRNYTAYNNFEDYKKFTEGVEVYIVKEGSKTKIDEG